MLAGLIGLGVAVPSFAHPDDPKGKNIEPAYQGVGWRAGQGGIAGLTFESHDVILQSWITVPEFGAHSWASDCWGYVSPSGREYAILGLSDGTGFVEITDPANPVIVGVVPALNSTWRDMKVFQEYAYAVTEAGDGIQVIPLDDIDNGNIGTVTTVTTGGSSATHNVALNEDSGFLYRCGGSGNGIRIYDLNPNPAVPAFVASWPDKYVHDCQVVTYDSGPYAGREVAFLCSGFNNGGTNTGLTILDVTDKGNIFQYGTHLEYPNNSYSHQGWLSEDKNYFYLGDELDEGDFGLPSTVHVIDVQDLDNPSWVGTFTNGMPSITHNLYTHQGLIFAANYTSGMRIFDTTGDPENPVEVAWFDTDPDGNAVNFDGLWSVYPYFPSGTIIGSDRQAGLFVWDLGTIPLTFDYPNGLPSLIPPAGFALDVEITEVDNDPVDSATAMMHYNDGSGFVDVPMTAAGASLYTATFPSLPCGQTVSFYFSATTMGGMTVNDPLGGAGSAYEAIVAAGEIITLNDDFEADNGWLTDDDGFASSGFWQRGVPVNDGAWDYDPETDGDGSGSAWLTQNEFGNTDVDGGAVILYSPVLDMSGGANQAIAYEYYARMTAPGPDMLLVEISSNSALGPWTEIVRHDADGGTSWHHHEITPADLADAGISLTSTMVLRFTANDSDPQSIVEAGLDGFTLKELDCPTGIPGDLNGDGVVDTTDFLMLLGLWGPCGDCDNCPADLDGNCDVGTSDFLALLANWTLP